MNDARCTTFFHPTTSREFPFSSAATSILSHTQSQQTSRCFSQASKFTSTRLHLQYFPPTFCFLEHRTQDRRPRLNVLRNQGKQMLPAPAMRKSPQSPRSSWRRGKSYILRAVSPRSLATALHFSSIQELSSPARPSSPALQTQFHLLRRTKLISHRHIHFVIARELTQHHSSTNIKTPTH